MPNKTKLRFQYKEWHRENTGFEDVAVDFIEIQECLFIPAYPEIHDARQTKASKAI